MDYGTAHPERQLTAGAAANQVRFLRARMNSSLSFELWDHEMRRTPSSASGTSSKTERFP
jgi:hypothetical protein